MGCGCKDNDNSTNDDGSTHGNSLSKYASYIFKFILFLISLCFLPFIFIYAIYMLFRRIVLFKNPDINAIIDGILNYYNNKKKGPNYDFSNHELIDLTKTEDQ